MADRGESFGSDAVVQLARITLFQCQNVVERSTYVAGNILRRLTETQRRIAETENKIRRTDILLSVIEREIVFGPINQNSESPFVR